MSDRSDHALTARLPQRMYDELAGWADGDSRTINLEIQYLLKLGTEVERERRKAMAEWAKEHGQRLLNPGR